MKRIDLQIPIGYELVEKCFLESNNKYYIAEKFNCPCCGKESKRTQKRDIMFQSVKNEEKSRFVASLKVYRFVERSVKLRKYAVGTVNSHYGL